MKIRHAIAATAGTALLGGCGAGEAETFTANGTVSAIGASQSDMLAAEGATDGERCQGVGTLGAFSAGTEVVIVDADGSKVAVGELTEGVLPEATAELGQLGFTACEFTFEVPDVPKGEGLYTLQVDQTETTLQGDGSDATDLEVEVAGDSYP